VTLKGALTSTNLKELGWHHFNDHYVSPGYEGAPSRLDIFIESAVGDVEVEVFAAPREVREWIQLPTTISQR